MLPNWRFSADTKIQCCVCVCSMYVMLLQINFTTAVVKLLQCCCYYTLLLLCVNVVYVSVIVCNVAVSKCHQCCGSRCCCNCAMQLYIAVTHFLYIPHTARPTVT